MPPQGNSRYLELLKAVTRSLEVKLRLKALDLAATLSMPDVAGEAVHFTRVIVANLSAVRLFTGEVTVCGHTVATTAPFLLK